MAKKTVIKTETKNYDVTVVYDVFHDVDKPISASMLGKIRKKADQIDIKTDRHIQITEIKKIQISTDGLDTKPIDIITDMSNGWETEMNTLLHSCSRFLRIHKIQIFVL